MHYILLFFTISAFANPIESGRIHSTVPLQNTEGLLVKFTDGTTGFIEGTTNKSLSSLRSGDLIEFERTDHNLTNLKIISNSKSFQISDDVMTDDEEERATIFPSYAHAQAQLDRFNSSAIQDSQCYNRSHVWAYEGGLSGITYKKAFLFFSDAYIERYKFPWWFHNSTYALVNMRGVVEERVMDKSFSQYPLKFKLWTDLFMKNKVECAVITKYSEYAGRPNTDDCFIIKSSRYFWQPKDLDAFERSGILKTTFIDWEITHAYKQAFGVD